MILNQLFYLWIGNVYIWFCTFYAQNYMLTFANLAYKIIWIHFLISRMAKQRRFKILGREFFIFAVNSPLF